MKFYGQQKYKFCARKMLDPCTCENNMVLLMQLWITLKKIGISACFSI